jgi:hypothetical protein
MLPLTNTIHRVNSMASTTRHPFILTHLVQQQKSDSIESAFNRRARLPSMLSNITVWLAFLFAIIVLKIDKHDFSTITRIIYGLTMLTIIIVCYVFVLVESRGCLEQILLKRCLHVDVIKREFASIQHQAKLNNYLSISATNYYNTLTRKYIDYRVGRHFSFDFLSICSSDSCLRIEQVDESKYIDMCSSTYIC